MRQLRYHLPALLLCAAAAAWLAAGGCGRKPIVGATARQTAQAFADALNSGALEQAAMAFDYTDRARQQNENWDEIPPGQRDLIVKKLAQEMVQQLATIKERLGANIKCGPVVDDRTVSLTGDAGTVSLELREREGKWYVTNVW